MTNKDDKNKDVVKPNNVNSKQPPLPPELEKKLKTIKSKLTKFQKEITKKFDKYIVAVSLLPPPKPEQMQKMKEEDKDKISVLVLIDDMDSKTMSKMELHQKLSTIIIEMAQKTDKKIFPEIILLSELWQNCYDGKYELLQMVSMSAPVYDNGMLAAIKIAEIHKSMVLKKFEKYIVSYVLAGSLTQGKSTKTSDIDVWIVIDDTDVKKMTRVELRDKLRAIIIGMGIEAGEMTGIKNKLNIQIYILTDFWDSLKEANPIIFTLLRDGVPFYDRGVFMPWKLLLRMGKIKPSAEAIDMFMSSGEQMLQRVTFKLKDICIEDIYYALLTPSQAALMMLGIPPPTPRETPELMKQIFVQKEKLLEANYISILEKIITLRKEIEHGTKKEITGKEVDDLLSHAKKYLKRIKRLFEQISVIKSEQDVVSIYESVITIIRDILKNEGIEKIPDKEIVKVFESEMTSKGKIPAKFLRILNETFKAKKDYDEKKLTKTEVEKVKKDTRELIKFMVEYIQRKRVGELERSKIKVKYGKKYGEVVLLGAVAFVIHDVSEEAKKISQVKLNPDGSFGTLKKSSFDELDKTLSEIEQIPKAFIKKPVFENLKKIFGKDVEILVNS
ncbi:hypothetical protein CEE44_00405 [Candidatus Woesearchaeota archaeon B3_Woes]|nr:MAG: hypothetical protein CEE44_00405 [Candidatus Woesearchaeota archaeon B3_Woes]